MLFVVGLGSGALPGQRQVACNPSFVESRVGGSISVQCGAGRADLQRIAASLERLRKEGRSPRTEFQRILATMNEILATSEKRFNAINNDLAEIRSNSRATMEMLASLSQGQLKPGPQYSAVRSSSTTARDAPIRPIVIRSLWPSWQQVVEHYPELQSAYGRGPGSLCMRCNLKADGKLLGCRLAGAESAPNLGDAARKMASLMRVYSPAGEILEGRSIVVPITFGVRRPSQYSPAFCSMFEPQDYMF